ncbi:MAG: hypothetical protein GX366_08795 [Epulopiscium sp.]|nr:hypothetical protein [Candidatus Epulonipiscium sp.]
MGKKIYIILFISICLTACGNSGNQLTTKETVTNKKIEMTYYEDQLTERELKAYEKIIERAEQISTEDIILEEGISDYELIRLTEAINIDRPDLFYIYEIEEIKLGGAINPYDNDLIDMCKKSEKTNKIKIEYIWDSKEEIEEAISQLDEKVKEITQKVIIGENIISAEKYLKNQLQAITEIDTEFIKKHSKRNAKETDKKEFLSMKAYGALVEEKASCGGFTSAYNLLLNEVGIESTGLQVLLSNQVHICNIVKINDKYVVVDLLNFMKPVFNKQFSELNYNAGKYELYSLFEHNLE